MTSRQFLHSCLALACGVGIVLVSGLDGEAQTSPRVSVDDVRISEGHHGTKTLTFTVRLSHAASKTLGVWYETANVTAAAGIDYEGRRGKINIPAGSLSNAVMFPVYGDTVEEFDEWLTLRLSSPDAGLVLGDAEASAEIINDDFRDPQLAGVTAQPSHVTDLRWAVNQIRAAAALSPFSFTDHLIAGMTPIRAVHITELRTALSAAYDVMGRTSPRFTDVPLVSGQTTLRAVHLMELRDAVADFTTDADYVIGFEQIGPLGRAMPVYTESGFTVEPTSGPWTVGALFFPQSTIVHFNVNAGDTAVGELRLTSGGDRFRFASIDLYSSTTTIPYIIIGLSGGVTVFQQQGAIGNTFGDRARLRASHPAAEIDTLLIRLTNAAFPCCSNPVGLDNIALNRGQSM